MLLKLLQLNIERGRFLDRVISYIKLHDFDIVQLQEITNGTISYNKNNCFTDLTKALGYQAELALCFQKRDEYKTFVGIATYVKVNFPIIKRNSIYMKPFEEIPGTQKMLPQDVPRNALHLVVEVNGKTLNLLNTHLAWGPTPTDEPYKLDQAKIVYEYLKTVSSPWILSGDFNLTPASQVVKWFDTLGRNLVVENNIANTLNPHTHRVREIFPEGLAVDFIYTSRNITVKNFKLIDTPDLSDHYGLSIAIEI